MRWISGDRFLWGVAGALSLMGLLVVYSATVSLVFRHHPTFPEYYLIKHFLTLLIAFLGTYAIHHTDYRRWGAYFGGSLGGVSLVLLGVFVLSWGEWALALYWGHVVSAVGAGAL